MTPGLFEAICAGVTLLLLRSGTIVGACVWILSLITRTKEEILEDFNEKHESNANTVKALETLVIRHDVLLNAEFGSKLNWPKSHLRG